MAAAEIVLAKSEHLLYGRSRNHQNRQTSAKPDIIKNTANVLSLVKGKSFERKKAI